MSHSPTNQPESALLDLSGLRCPICGREVFRSWLYPDDWAVCHDMGHWVGPASECKPAQVINDGDNVLYAEGYSNVAH